MDGRLRDLGPAHDEIEDVPTGSSQFSTARWVRGSGSRSTGTYLGPWAWFVGRWADVYRRRCWVEARAAMFTLADLKVGRLLGTFDEWALDHGRDADGRPERLTPTRVPENRPVAAATFAVARSVRSCGRRVSAGLPVARRPSARSEIAAPRGREDMPGLYVLGSYCAGASRLLSTGSRMTLVRSSTWRDIRLYRRA